MLKLLESITFMERIMNHDRMLYSDSFEPSDEFLDAEIAALYRPVPVAPEPPTREPVYPAVQWGRAATIRARRIGQTGRFALGRSL